MSSINAAHDPALAWPEDGQIGAARSGRPLTSYLSLAAMIVPAVILLGIGLLAGAPPKGDDIEQGVTIGDVSVSGGDWEKVGPKLQAAFDDFVQTPVRLVVAGNEIEVTPAELGLTFDLEATHERALGIGRGGLFTGAGERLIAHTRGYEVDPVVRVDEQAFLAVIEPLAQEALVPPVNARFYFDGEQLTVRPGEDGVGVDPTAALQQLIDRAVEMRSGGMIEAPTTVVEPEITTAQLEAALDEARRLSSGSLNLTDGDAAWQLASPDLAQLMAYEDGRVVLNEALLEARIAALAPSIDQIARNAEIIRNEDGTFTIRDEQIERKLDVEATTEAAVAAILDGDDSIPLVIHEAEPPATRERIMPLYTKLTEMVTRGVTLSWSEGAIDIDKKALADSLVWNVTTGEWWFDHEKLAAAIQPIADAATRAPTNLRWLDGQVVAGEGSQPGLRGDAWASIPAVIDALTYGHEFAELTVHEDTAFDPATLGINIQHVLGSASTYYGDSSANRKTNVEVAARALNGAMIPPGGTFSFNDAIGGTATLEDGYMMGYGIVAEGGEVLTVPSVAGGICQVSTTTFQAAFWAGMPIVERSWHLYWIPRYGNGVGGLQGLDATVDPDYGLDFKFHNPTDQWLAISAWADGQYIGVEVWGVHQGWTVEVEGPEITNVIEASDEIIRRTDESLNPGQEVWVENAEDGFTAAIHRVVKDSDGNVLDDHVFTSFYQPASNVVLVGP